MASNVLLSADWKKNSLLNAHERKVVAYPEMGQSLLNWRRP